MQILPRTVGATTAFPTQCAIDDSNMHCTKIACSWRLLAGREIREGSYYREGLEHNPLDSTATPLTVIPCIHATSSTPRGMRETGTTVVRKVKVYKVRVHQTHATTTGFVIT